MAYLLYCLDKPDHAEVRRANRQAHLDYLDRINDKILMAGPLLSDDGQMIGSLLAMDFAERHEAEAFAANDPYAQAGLFQSVAIHGFRKTLP